MPANPVMGPDAIDAFFEWLEEMIKLGLPTTDDAYVFPVTRNQAGHTTKNGHEIIEVVFGNAMQSSGISSGIQYWFDKAELEILPKMKRKPTPHSLIKLTTTNLLDADVAEVYLNIFRGKRGMGTMGDYNLPPDHVLIEKFKAGYHAITISDTKQTDELARVKAENTELQNKNAEFERRLQALEDNEKATNEQTRDAHNKALEGLDSLHDMSEDEKQGEP